MGKKKTGGKKGPPEHFTDPKRTFLDSHSSAFMGALDNNRAGEFYDFVTREFIVKFGNNTSTVESTPVPESSEGGNDGESSEDDNDGGMRSKARADAASANFVKVRAVSLLINSRRVIYLPKGIEIVTVVSPKL
jgi:hypothetical protein